MIYVIGAGAIGKALAVMLKLTGRQVILMRGSIDAQAQKPEKIAIRLSSGEVLQAHMPVSTFSDLNNIDGILLIASKSYGNQNIAAKLLAKKATGPIVLLQNGLHIEQPFVEAGFKKVYRCVLMATSQVNDDGVIQFKPVAASPVGAISYSDDLSELIEQLNNPWFPFRHEAFILPAVWKKTIANCVFNSICPLLETDNGIFHKNAEVFAIARRVIAECVEVAGRTGIKLDTWDVEELVLQISRSSDGQFISTLQDIRRGTPTEIDTLNLAVAGVAERYQLSNLVTQTRLLGELIAIKSKLALK